MELKHENAAVVQVVDKAFLGEIVPLVSEKIMEDEQRRLISAIDAYVNNQV